TPGLSTADYPQPTAGGSAPRHRPAAGPVSTARAAGAATAPLPSRSGSQVEGAEELPNAARSSGGVVGATRRPGLYVALGVIAGVLAAGGAVAAYFAIKSARESSAAGPEIRVRDTSQVPPAGGT